MRKLIFILILSLSPLAGRVAAADFSPISQVPVIVNLVILLGAMACLVIAVRLFVLVKGGALARGWQMLVVSFVTLTAGQIFILAEKLHFFALTFDVAGILYLATVALWFMSLMQTRKVLG
jgi:hypothetical protein